MEEGWFEGKNVRQETGNIFAVFPFPRARLLSLIAYKHIHIHTCLFAWRHNKFDELKCFLSSTKFVFSPWWEKPFEKNFRVTLSGDKLQKLSFLLRPKLNANASSTSNKIPILLAAWKIQGRNFNKSTREKLRVGNFVCVCWDGKQAVIDNVEVDLGETNAHVKFMTGRFSGWFVNHSEIKMRSILQTFGKLWPVLTSLIKNYSQ